MQEKDYRGYRAYQYLEPGVDFKECKLSKETGIRERKEGPMAFMIGSFLHFSQPLPGQNEVVLGRRNGTRGNKI
ncbi:hypothetical protein [uncultured Brevibacillus sp.]|uniref:hypothetical protein n=1 Tax=uncultured Brevibacillus sp. TaxID=169970 RepID=UPI00259AE0F6|nr:hypothetical protein [uncultured Brevibacillus sp.]